MTTKKDWKAMFEEAEGARLDLELMNKKLRAIASSNKAFILDLQQRIEDLLTNGAEKHFYAEIKDLRFRNKELGIKLQRLVAQLDRAFAEISRLRSVQAPVITYKNTDKDLAENTHFNKELS